MVKVAVVGAGPVGCYVSYLLAKKGFEVELFDSKREKDVGKPVQCTGIFPSEIKELLVLREDFLVNTFSGIEVFSPSGRKIRLSKTEYLVDREKFDKYLFKMALDEGVIFNPGHRLIEIKRNDGRVNLVFRCKGKELVVSPKIVVGADGPLSLVYSYLNPRRRKRFYYGVQAVVKGKFDVRRYGVFFGRKVCPGFFGWVVPESTGRARVGLATLKGSREYFDGFLKKLGLGGEIVEKQGGLIPIFDPGMKRSGGGGRVFLLGDAASWVKATTGGGIVPAFQEARRLVDCLVKERKYKPCLGNLKKHLFLRKMLNRFSDKDYDRLVRLLSKPKNRRVLEKSSREKVGGVVWRLGLREPRLWSFIKYLF